MRAFRRRVACVLMLAATVATAAVYPAAAVPLPPYRIAFMVPLPGSIWTKPVAAAPNGIVVGQALMPDLDIHPVLWATPLAPPVDLAVVPGAIPALYSYVPTAVSSDGVVVGHEIHRVKSDDFRPPQYVIDSTPERPWVIDRSRRLHYLAGPKHGLRAYAVSSAGRVYGNRYGAYRSSFAQPHVWRSDGSLQHAVYPGCPHAFGELRGANERGIAVGKAALSSYDVGAVYRSGRLFSFDIRPPGGRPYASGRANDVNERGEIAGEMLTSYGQEHAYLRSGNRIYDLGPAGSAAMSVGRAINASGAVAGQIQPRGWVSPEAAVTYRGVMTPIARLAGHPEDAVPLTDAVGITDSGMVIGTTGLGGGFDYGFVAIPTGRTHAAAPRGVASYPSVERPYRCAPPHASLNEVRGGPRSASFTWGYSDSPDARITRLQARLLPGGRVVELSPQARRATVRKVPPGRYTLQLRAYSRWGRTPWGHPSDPFVVRR